MQRRNEFRQGGERAGANAEQPQTTGEVDTFEALAGGTPNRLRVQCVSGEGKVAGDDAEVVEPQLDADRAARVPLAAQIVGKPDAEFGEDLAERFAVAHGMQIAFESRFAADRLRLAEGHDRPIVAAVRGVVQPRAVADSEVPDQPHRLGCGDVAHGAKAELLQLLVRLRPDAVDLPGCQRPDARGDVVRPEQGQAARLVELGGQLRKQLVRRDADRAAEAAGGLSDRVFQPLCERPAGIGLSAGQVGQVDVDLVDAAVLDDRGDGTNGCLEEPRVVAVPVEIDRQQHSVGCQLRGLHRAHRREHAECARLVGAGRHHAAPGVVAQQRIAAGTVAAVHRLVPPPAADHNRTASQIGITQQLDGGVKGVHVEVGNQAAHRTIVLVKLFFCTVS